MGLPLGISFALVGVHTTLIDINETAIAEIQAGRFPFKEAGGDQALPRALKSGNLRAVSGPASVIGESDIVVLQISGTVSMNQVLRDIADPNGKPHPPFELVVVPVHARGVREPGRGQEHQGQNRNGDTTDAERPAQADIWAALPPELAQREGGGGDHQQRGRGGRSGTRLVLRAAVHLRGRDDCAAGLAQGLNKG